MAEGVFASPDERRAYILQGAQQRGIDPSLIDRLVRSEGGYSGYDRTGDHGQSFGPFQDYIGGGLGNTMLGQGLDPTNPRNELAVINWNLDYIQKHGASPDTWHGLRRGQQAEGYYGGAQHINVQKDIPPEADNSLLLYAGILDALGGESGKDESKPAFGTLQADTAGQPTPGATARTKPEQGDELLNAIKDRLDQTHPPNQLSGQALPGIPGLPGVQQPSMQMAGMPVPPAAPQGMEVPDIIAPAPRSQDYPQDDEYGRIPKEGPALTPVRPPQDTQTAGLYNGVLNALKQFNPIGSAQAGELPVRVPRAEVLPPGEKSPLSEGQATDVSDQKLLRSAAPGGGAPSDQGGHGIENILSAIATGGLGAAGALGEDINNILGGLAQSLTPQGYLQQEERLMSGQMTPQELAGFVTSHIAGGAPPSSMSAGIRLPSRAHLAEASKDIQKFFSPTTVDPAAGVAETLFRESTGQARRATSEAESQVGTRGPLTNPGARPGVLEAFRREPWRPIVNKYVPEFQQYLDQVKAGAVPLQKPALLKFLDFVESRSSGATYAGPAELRDLADVLQDIYANRAAEIAAEPSTQWAGFVQDYFPHMWQEKQRAASYGAGTGGQGSGRSLKQRSIPTVSDGIAAGLTPVSLDPIEMTMRYVGNIDRYLAHNAIFRIGRDGGFIKFFQPGKIPEGWAPLKGRLAQRAVATGGQPGALGLTAAAPEGFARVYNNGVSSGFFEHELGGKVYEGILATKNGITQTALSMSAFHALAMSQEASASAIANGIQNLRAGDIRHALRDLGLGAIPLVKATKDVATTGRKMERQYAGIQDYGPDFEKMADLWARAGGGASGRGREWQATEAGNFITSVKRGTTMLELKAGLREIANRPHVLSQTAGLIKYTATQFGRIMDTISAPLFDVMIPRIKKAAFYDEMSTWLRHNPTATIGEQVARARQVMDTMDDRFGEMMMDNIFWAKAMKQSLQIGTVSLGWELGSIRSLGGSQLDLVRGASGAFGLPPKPPIFTPRVRYAIGLGTAVAIGNAAYQYLMTGKTPGEDTGGLLSKGGALDLALPRTGGKTPEGAYERALLPGFEKDILGYSYNFPYGIPAELAGKLSGLGKLVAEGFSTRDSFTGKPIAPFPAGTPDWYKAWADHVLSAMRPIPTKQDIYKGSAIPTWQRYMGIRPAAEKYQNPERIDQIEYASRMKDLQSEMRSLVAHGSRTTQEPKYIQQRMREIQDEMKRLTTDFQKQLKADQADRLLHRPPSKGPAMEFREAPGQVLQ